MTGSVGSASPEEQFGQGVRAARQARGWSQDVLAAELAKVGINVGGQSGVARIERGERPTRLNEIVGIADFLGIYLNLDLGMYGTNERISEFDELENALSAITTQLDEADKARIVATEEAAHADWAAQAARKRLMMAEQHYRETERKMGQIIASIRAAEEVREQIAQIRKSSGE